MPDLRDEFEALAKSEGHDLAYTYDTERSRHVYLSPMTADLWRYFQAATERAAKKEREECAKLVDALEDDMRIYMSEWQAVHACAAAIRAREGKGGAG